MPNKVLDVITSEFDWLSRPGFALMHGLLGLLPQSSAGRLRASIYRAFGWRIGPRALMLGTLTLSSPGLARRNISIGEGAIVNAYVHIDASAAVDIQDDAGIGHHVIIITTDHDIGGSGFRAGETCPKPVTIGRGAWIGAGAMILPGVSIGEGAVVAAGSMVRRDVPANSLVAGNPARMVRELAGVDAAPPLGLDS